MDWAVYAPAQRAIASRFTVFSARPIICSQDASAASSAKDVERPRTNVAQLTSRNGWHNGPAGAS